MSSEIPSSLSIELSGVVLRPAIQHSSVAHPIGDNFPNINSNSLVVNCQLTDLSWAPSSSAAWPGIRSPLQFDSASCAGIVPVGRNNQMKCFNFNRLPSFKFYATIHKVPSERPRRHLPRVRAFLVWFSKLSCWVSNGDSTSPTDWWDESIDLPPLRQIWVAPEDRLPVRGRPAGRAAPSSAPPTCGGRCSCPFNSRLIIKLTRSGSIVTSPQLGSSFEYFRKTNFREFIFRILNWYSENIQMISGSSVTSRRDLKMGSRGKGKWFSRTEPRKGIYRLQSGSLIPKNPSGIQRYDRIQFHHVIPFKIKSVQDSGLEF